MKTYQCAVCKKQFVKKISSLQKVCSYQCALAFAEAEKKKKQEKLDRQERIKNRKRLKAYKEANKTHNDLIKEAQSAVNKYIRMRDENKECISCGTPLISEKLGGGFDAGHYRSRGAAPHLRFYTLNIFGQCKRCNRYLGGNYHEYRIGLIERLGIEKVEAIEADQRPRHYSDEDLRRIKRIFNKKVNLLAKRKK
ncbi:Bacteriophage Lambda NinG protein [Gallibacterium anatis]|uniref:Bacteriophage Lambda NinG protein n=1 Tax=Gallibacterium anatis TaxID=750 RepID=A0A377H4T7_9PAST|nr:recombination protein NinG [Gallibacterium anatis]KGQ55358.1 recombinase NinG [Gallibacterium anatis DSM 16844 = F 149]STO37595.1 Bacteriophage Lambda NinG protein [Gallibacterium anatis]